ncbi:hypothetical protein AAFF_G00171650 [Aldrovandia affinis]|uniref:Uncharacterized protein n=1 Tax=Aldrovandia affinis TaxID=143900 RepID=A0AAD7SYK3_9TELE|nr:hypothetical protein AAFF_G00171650 [Aldrovandia affinis]
MMLCDGAKYLVDRFYAEVALTINEISLSQIATLCTMKDSGFLNQPGTAVHSVGRFRLAVCVRSRSVNKPVFRRQAKVTSVGRPLFRRQA